MGIPKTNLFKGDRVRLSPKYLSTKRTKNIHTPMDRWADRTGTIVSDTLDPEAESILVHWDGNAHAAHRYDRGYMPDELVLYEEEDDDGREPTKRDAKPVSDHAIATGTHDVSPARRGFRSLSGCADGS